LSIACTIGRGVRQECLLSPLLYLIYDETIISEVTDNMETGISVDGPIINNIRYAYDNVVVANSQKGLQQLMVNLNKVTSDRFRGGPGPWRPRLTNRPPGLLYDN